ncbi:integral membrane protein S linking to the trans Golgi network-domain-containing protein [Infundibulicybe gibba]|nr:integral membrane protein S linking to the trans Golgi network-domain-containing protein [Infundibulicybe gibba]
MAPQPTSNWDPVLLISQESRNAIVSMQTLHYLTLCIFTPPLLSFFAESTSLTYEGGASNVGMVMDWREMAGRPTVRGMHGGERWSSITWAWSEGKKVGFGWREDQWDGQIDPMRGWIIAFCWMVACSADIYYLYTLIRRPRLILDFALTLVFNHLVLTTYYSASIPTSLFFWLVLIGGSILTVIIAEQLCVKREMSEGLKVSVQADEEEIEEMELGALSRRD